MLGASADSPRAGQLRTFKRAFTEKKKEKKENVKLTDHSPRCGVMPDFMHQKMEFL